MSDLKTRLAQGFCKAIETTKLTAAVDKNGDMSLTAIGQATVTAHLSLSSTKSPLLALIIECTEYHTKLLCFDGLWIDQFQPFYKL